MEREATSGYHLLNRLPVRSVKIPSGNYRLRSIHHTDKVSSTHDQLQWYAPNRLFDGEFEVTS